MTILTNWLSPSAMHSLGWTLLHFLWQGTAVAALAAVLMTLMPSRLHPLHAGSGRTGPDARRAGRNVLLSVSIFQRSRLRAKSAPSQQSAAHAATRNTRGKNFIQRFPPLALARYSALAGGSLAARSGILQPSFRWRIPAARTRAPQAVHHRERSCACDVPDSATPPWSRAGHPLLRVHVAASAGSDWLVPSHRAVAGDRSHRTYPRSNCNWSSFTNWRTSSASIPS